MLISTTSVASVLVAIIGVLILWSNPGRAVNRVVFACSLHFALWLACLSFSVFVPRSLRAISDGVFWLRLSCALAAWGPLDLWVVKETIANGSIHINARWFKRSSGWIAISVVLFVLCFTEYFIPSHSSESQRVRGWGYYFYIGSVICLYGYVLFDMVKSLQKLVGGKRLELQVWLGGGCITTSAILVTMALNAITGNHFYIRLQPVMILVFYAGTAYAVTTYRIFDAQQILRLGANKLVLGVVVTAVAYGIYSGAHLFMPEAVAFLPTIVAALLCAALLRSWLDRKLQFFPQALEVRQAAFAAARRESRVDGLEAAFVNVLKGWAQTDHALVLSSTTGPLRGGNLEISEDSVVLKALREIHWVSPERLARERETPERALLGQFLTDHQLGVAVLGGTPSLAVLSGVGVAASRRPFTYPQVMQLMELTSIFEGAFERAQLSVKMQHTEQLATVGLLGASLAHEIRNPLVTIKTFVQLLPSRHNDEAFRDKFFKLMVDEVARIDRLTEQLLDLASPRTYSAHQIELHPVLRGGLELVAGKAKEKQVELIVALQASPDKAFADASAVKQVLLNLCLNAIQALDVRPSGRCVNVTTRNLPESIELIVSDNGPGIAPEIQARLFQPFQTTKSSGFGLGLAICRDILTNLGATITIDPPEPGCGATFRVTFPCRP